MSNVSDFIERFGPQIKALMVFAPLPFVLPITGFVNPLWTGLFALLPWLVVVVIDPHPVYADHPISEFLAWILWPPAVFFGIIWLSQEIVSSKNNWRFTAIAIWLLSALVIIPAETLVEFNSRWPVFGVYD